MKVHHLVVAASAALLSFGAIAGGQQQSQSKENAAPQTSTEATIVREAQDRLRSQGYAATPQGLAEFQQAKGIEASGKLDEQTLAALGVDASAASGASSERAPQGERPKY
jgi:hypothetical protein